VFKEIIQNEGCNNGNYPQYAIAVNGITVHEGQTCRCGCGCSETEGIRETLIKLLRDNPQW
jgi:hypothetical protein